MTQLPDGKQSFSIRKLRNIILVCMVVGVSIYTGIMFSLAQRLSERFGPQVRADLEWRVQRGAQELGRACELALALADAELLEKCFGAYAQSKDVQALVAVDAAGKVVAQHGSAPAIDLFSGPAGALHPYPRYLTSWAEVQIEGTQVGKVAVVVTTQRLREAQELLDRSSNMTLTGGLGALLVGTIIVCFFTGAVAIRDAQLSDYAKNLERKVEERTRELDERNAGMRLVLDHVAQGFITIALNGKMFSERSAIVDRWFQAPPAEITLQAYLQPYSARFAEQLELGLSALQDNIMPIELLLYQLPSRLLVGDSTFEASYSPIGDPESPERLLVILSDVTAAVARERAEREQRELISLFQRITDDRSGVEEFLIEAAHLVGALRDESDRVVQQRLVHTLKGNCASYGLESYAELAHQTEERMIESGEALDGSARSLLTDAWKRTIARVGWLLGASQRGIVQLDASELDALAERALAGATPREVADTLADWKREPGYRRLERLARQARTVAERLGKPPPRLELDDGGVRLEGDGLSPFWSAMVHVVRNALDHGIEDPATRTLAGKPEAGTVALSLRRQGGKLIVSVRDDGRGLDWERLREQAALRGLAHATREELVEALFCDGVSTKSEATDVSGRGVGLAALRQVVRGLGGTIEVESLAQQGTVFRFVLDEGRTRSGASPEARRPRPSLVPKFS
ncbi:MAG: Signal transduction histidine kinase CheA [Myxococcaceae bacterium]|nr:Signal transduction histidine kinase CheA [Myxococcaceae bacterium]